MVVRMVEYLVELKAARKGVRWVGKKVEYLVVLRVEWREPSMAECSVAHWVAQ